MVLNWLLDKLGTYNPSRDLKELLTNSTLQEEFLGVSDTRLPAPDKIINDARQLVKYSQSHAYKIFAKEAWSRMLSHLDHVLDGKTSTDSLHFHRGALRATLDLLRLSYQAKATAEALEKEQRQNVSLSR